VSDPRERAASRGRGGKKAVTGERKEPGGRKTRKEERSTAFFVVGKPNP